MYVPAPAPVYMPAPAPMYAPPPSYQGYAPPPQHAYAAPAVVAPSKSWTAGRVLAVVALVGVVIVAGLCVLGLALGERDAKPATSTSPTPVAPVAPVAPVVAPVVAPPVVAPGVVAAPAPAARVVSWADSAGDFRERTGEAIPMQCPPGGRFAAVWGTGVYTDDSSICTAAVHAGLATVEQGGVFALVPMPGQARYQGSTAHGVTTQDFGVFPGSFSLTRRAP